MPPDAQTVHGGYGLPDWPRMERIREWLKANGIEPRLVAANRPVYVLAVPNGTTIGGVAWLVDVIVFHEYYENPDGVRELNLITREVITFQRTVPLIVPFPADPTTDDGGSTDGQAVSEAAEEAAQVEVRDPQQEGVSAGHEGEGPQRPGQGQPARNESAAEEGSSRSHEAVPEPEEVRRRPEEEVGEA